MRIAFVSFEQMLATSYTNAFELFFSANQVAKTILKDKAPSVQLQEVGCSTQTVPLNSGLSITPQTALDDQKYELVYLPAIWRNPKRCLKQHAELIPWLQQQYEMGAILTATGTGVCFIAESGILNGRAATTHWHYFDEFQKNYPNVALKRQHFITQTNRIYCAGSINAQTDLTLHHVHRIYGKQVADHLSRHFSHEVRGEYDKLSFQQDRNANHADEQILQAQLWMQAKLSDHQLSIEQVAIQFGMSVRTFNRRFKMAADVSPTKYLQLIRHKQAKELLRSGNLAVGEIAYRVGYLDASYFAKLFTKLEKLNPSGYRKTIRANMFNTDQL